MGGGPWASNSPCDFTDRRLGQERFHPQGDTEPLVWDQQRTRRAQTPPQTFLRPSPTSENRLSRHHQQQQGPPPPPALPYRAPQRHGDPQAGLSLSNPGPLAPGSGSVFLASAPPTHTHTHSPNLCSLPPSFPYCEEIILPELLPLPWPGWRNGSCQPSAEEASSLGCTHPKATAGAARALLFPVGSLGAGPPGSSPSS